jgi:methylase of polypeptide subunit release factors
MNSEPYLASEDSAFLREVLRGYRGERCLEIGAGNAGNLIELAKRFPTAVGTDIARPSMTDWKGRTSFVLADTSSCFRSSCFDLVTFNPPYLQEELGDRTVRGGQGLEVPKKFLADALRAVRPGGKVVLLLNGDADVDQFEEEAAKRGFRLKKIADRHLFFEELSIYEASAAPRA